jgi:hypothetical protein
MVGQAISTFEGHERVILSHCWLGNRAMASADSRTVLVWDVESATPLLTHHNSDVRAAATLNRSHHSLLSGLGLRLCDLRCFPSSLTLWFT